MGEDWDDSLQSKQQIEASLLSKHEATMRRERAMAYSFTHQVTWFSNFIYALGIHNLVYCSVCSYLQVQDLTTSSNDMNERSVTSGFVCN